MTLFRAVRPIVSSAAVFDITTLAWSSLYTADYSGMPWAAVASAGASAANGNLTTTGSDPTTGTAQNGKVPAALASASSQYMQNSTAASTLFSTTAGTIVALYYGVSAAAPSGNIYDDAALYVDAGVANLGLTYTTSGFQGFVYDGAYKNVAVAAATGQYHLVMMRWDGANLGMTLNSAAESTLAAGTITTGAGIMHVGRGYGVTFLNGRLLMFGTANVTFSPTNFANIKSAVNSIYGLAL